MNIFNLLWKLDPAVGRPVQGLLHTDGEILGLRENFKYYFADFVRKGGTTPPFTDIPPKNVLQKMLKMVFVAQKTLVFGPKIRLN